MIQGVALQLYTMREQMQQDAAQCLRDVAAIGYGTVEFAGFGTLDVPATRKVLDETGLFALSTHVEYEDLDGDLSRVIDEHLELGCRYVVVQQALSEHFESADTVRRLAAQFDEWGARCAAAGLLLGYHGYHDFDREFARYGDTTLYDLLVTSTDPAVFHVQLDTFWVRHVGDDPVAALHRYAGRVRMLHAKEAASGPGGGDAPVGLGVIDWPAVVSAADDVGVEWLIVEQEDDPAHALRDVATSLENLTRFQAEVNGSETAG